MKRIVVYTTLLLNMFLVSCSGQAARAQAQEEPVFSVEAKNRDDQITFQYEDNTTVIEIDSPSGIGFATITHESGQLPERMIAQLHLKGLEELRLVSDQVMVVASISSGTGLSQSQNKISGNSEQAIQSSDPLWLDIEIVSDSQKIPLQNGYFEIVLPMEFIKQSGSSFEINWIDFFR